MRELVEDGQISIGYIWEKLTTRLYVVGNLKPATMSNILRHPLYGGKEFSDYTGGKPTKSPIVFVECSQTDKKASLVNKPKETLLA